jgi:hypothetical protein
VAKPYTASKSRTQGRDGWSVIFRHPVRIDPGTGRPGRRVRRGLGTSDDAEADHMVEQINEILATPDLWERSARLRAAARFDERVVDVFYEGMEMALINFTALRDDLIALPGGYRHVLLIGTTGAGKTTVARQFLGIDPRTERFPSTSTAKTTVADTEIILRSDDIYRAAVTFAGRDDVIDHLTENAADAALAIYQGRGDAEVRRRLLDHVNQRYRFSYVLGRARLQADDDDDDYDDEYGDPDEGEAGDGGPESLAGIDVAATQLRVTSLIATLKGLVEKVTQSGRREVMLTGDEDPRLVEELIEEELDASLREDDEFHGVVDSLMEEIEARFAAIPAGELRRNRQGWPQAWSYSSQDRAAFLREIARFTSNYAPHFGRLLTPLTNGIRVSGPFRPDWAPQGAQYRLVLIDVEGLGHTPKSAATISTSLAQRVEEADAVLLVDSATQPMQAAPVTAIKSIAVAGRSNRLYFLFTHLDEVKGANLPRLSDREEHVRASAENAIRSVGDDLGPAAERALRRRIDKAGFFAGALDVQMSGGKAIERRSMDQLRRLATALASACDEASAGSAKPVFSLMNLSLAITEAARSFHDKWRGLLGLSYNPDAPKEHWTRIKALSRRLGEGWNDEYDDLQPVADLRYQLQRQIWLMLQKPVRWQGAEPTEDERAEMIDQISNAITQHLFTLTARRMKEDRQNAWLEAYAQKGRGSSYSRATLIATKVYDRGAPIPSVVASPDQNSFMAEVAQVVTKAAGELGFILE